MEKHVFEKAGKLNALNYAISMRNATEFVRSGYHLVRFMLDKRKTNLQEIVCDASYSNEGLASFPPGDNIQIGDEKYSIKLLLQMCAQIIFQSAHSFFDYCAQCINCVFVEHPLPESDVSFSKVRTKCNNLAVAKWMEKIEDDFFYKLICDINNKTKHYEIMNLHLHFVLY